MSAEQAVWPEGVARHLLAEVDSTNAEADRLAPHLTQPTWIMARHQTAARGRRGRVWVSPPGNFAATLVFRPPGEPAEFALRSFVAALALDEALSRLIGPRAGLALKWPNDVLLNGGKAAGILLEGARQAGQVGHLIVGVGVNLIAAPPPADVAPDALLPVSVMGETGLRITPDEMLDALAAAFARFEAQFVTYGFGPIRTAWLNRAARLGQRITARTGTDSIEGTFETLADDGALVMMTASGRRAIPAADVFF